MASRKFPALCLNLDDNGDISAHLATDRALQLFEPVRESDYIGYAGSAVGPRGLDENALSEYEIVDDV
jgi:hypothetical protein